MAKKKRPGRPKKKAKERQAATVIVRMSKLDRKAVEAAAAASNATLSQWTRDVLLTAARPTTILIEDRKARESNPTAADTAGQPGM